MTKLSKETQEAVKGVLQRCGYAVVSAEIISVERSREFRWVVTGRIDGELRAWRLMMVFNEEALEFAANETRCYDVTESSAVHTMGLVAADETAGRLQPPAQPMSIGKSQAMHQWNEAWRRQMSDTEAAEPSGRPHGGSDVVVRYYTGNTRIQEGPIVATEIWEGDGTSDGRRVFRYVGERDGQGRRIFGEVDQREPTAFLVGRRLATVRSAMEAMSNVATGMRDAARARVECLEAYAAKMRQELPFTPVLNVHAPPILGRNGSIESFRKEVEESGKREWSAEVRAKVAALKPPGPQVYCAGDWEED